jgi:undecaprenyl diphosphate synthase
MALKTDLTTAPVATGASGEAVPAHVAIIMDGNGRWAARRGLPRVEGHRRGVEAVRRTVRSAIELGIRYLTIYSFSAENWRRPPQEVSDLMGLLKRFIRHDLADLHANNVRVRIIGRGADPPQPRPDPRRRLQLWRPSGARPCGAGHRREGSARRDRPRRD